MATDPRVQRVIEARARAHGVDPQAALAVASVEGGVHYGAKGDSGTSFGPFQLHIGGALPKQYSGSAQAASAFANSPAGIEFAIRQMAQAGAKGLTGRAAVEAIVTKFERPAAPGAEVEKAFGRYGQFKAGAGAAQAGAQEAFASSPAGVAFGPNPAMFQAQATSMFLAQAQAAAAGKQTDFSGLVQLAQAKKQYALAAQGAALDGGSIQPPTDSSGRPPGLTDPHTSSTVKNILSIAHAQIGKPYVWGGESPAEGGFDCSGLIDYAYKKAGVKLPGRLTSQSILGLGQSVKGGQYQPGDMIVANGGKHVVMYVGNGQVIAAPHRGEVVQYQPVSRFSGNIVDVRRVL